MVSTGPQLWRGCRHNSLPNFASPSYPLNGSIAPVASSMAFLLISGFSQTTNSPPDVDLPPNPGGDSENVSYVFGDEPRDKVC